MSAADLCLISASSARPSCSLELLGLTTDAVLVYAAAMVCVFNRACVGADAGADGDTGADTGAKSPSRYMGHNLIWLLMTLRILITIVLLTELLMTNQVFLLSLIETSLHLIMAILLPIYFDYVELSDSLLALAPLLLHLVSSAVLLGLRDNLLRDNDFFSFHLRLLAVDLHLLFDLLLALLVLLNLSRSLHCRYIRRSPNNVCYNNRGGSNERHSYKHHSVSLFSKLTFAWMLPLLCQGYKAPLEMDDLHALPVQERARSHSQSLKSVLEERSPSKKLILACIKMNLGLVFTGGVARLMADIFAFAGALSIKLIVDAIARNESSHNNNVFSNESFKSDDNNGDQSNNALTINAFLNNAYVISCLIFFFGICQGLFSQASTHLSTIAGVRAKNALLVLLYEKSLKLPVANLNKNSNNDDSPVNPTCPLLGVPKEEVINEGNIDIGLITTLASEDILNVREFLFNIHYIWSLPLRILVLVVCLADKMGFSGGIGVVVGTAIIVPLQMLVGKLMSDNNKRIFEAQDTRLYLCTETLQGMKTVKLGCLEQTRLNVINNARDRELVYLRRDSFFWSIMAFLASVSTIIVTTLTIGLYVMLEEHNFSASDIFTSLALLGQLSVCLSVFPVTVPIFIKALVSRDRLQEFFARQEVTFYRQRRAGSKFEHSLDEENEDDDNDDEEEQDLNNNESNDLGNVNEGDKEGDIKGNNNEGNIKDSKIDRQINMRSDKPSSMRHAVLTKESYKRVQPTSPTSSPKATSIKTTTNNNNWTMKTEKAFELISATFGWPLQSIPTLSNITMVIPKSSLTIIVGPSGSGKSALLASLAGEMSCQSGQFKWHLNSTKIAFTGQRPWLMNASIKDNVLLGRPLKEKRYKKVLQACDLLTDIDLLPMGDETEVGERGVLLSGGQRQRLAIARCLYSRACCTILDAPFSALDANIARHVFEEGIIGLLLKRKRTVVMSTDRLDLLNRADQVVVLRQGQIAAQGSLQQVQSSCPDFCTDINESIDDHGKTANERWRLLKNVTRWSLRLKQLQRHNEKQNSNNRAQRQTTISLSDQEPSNKRVVQRLQSLNSSRSRLNRQLWTRMDSSSQLNLCHDIMLASDECDSFSTSSDDPSSAMAEAMTLKRHQAVQKRAQFSRASSWSTSLTVLQRLNSNANQRRNRNRPASRNSSSSSLVRAQQHSSSSSSGAIRPQYRPQSINQRSQFQRMRSFQMAAIRNRLKSASSNGSTHSLPKGSVLSSTRNVEPDFNSSFSTEVFSSRQSSVHDSTTSGSRFTNRRILGPMNRMTSTSSAISGFSDDLDDEDYDENDENLNLMPLLNSSSGNQEKRGYGTIRFRIYTKYLLAGGPGLVACFLLLSLALQVLKVQMDFLLRDWAMQPKDKLSISYFYNYSTLSVLALVVSCVANLMGQLMGARARALLHKRMLENLLKCPLELFETYPIGRILNRFSYDLFVVDQKLPSCIQRLVLVTLICGSALAVNALLSKGLFLIFVLPMLALYYWLQHFYRCSSRELQRLDSISRAPIFSHLTDTLSGLITLRAFKEQSRFIYDLCDKIDSNTSAFLVLQSGCRWLGVTLDLTGALMVLMSVLVHLTFSEEGAERSSTVGLTLNYSLLVPIYLAWVVKFLSDIENYMNAVERIVEYADLQPEENDDNDNDDDSTNQDNGEILHRLQQLSTCSSPLSLHMISVGLAHSLDVRAVVHNLSLVIPGGQKLGICGRSGSGKSTLLLALPRIAKIVYGQIKLDDLDLKQIPLPILRRLILTVPQDVTLFSGSIRSNLDPEQRVSDAILWETLDQLELRDLVEHFDKGLDAEVAENGDNLSQGQRQQLSLARAILLRPPILLLDETTSNLDSVKELHLHKLLLKALGSSTVITVAHRLGCLVHYDRVLVMGEGRVLEDGRPRDLLKKPMGFFSALWRAAGHAQKNPK